MSPDHRISTFVWQPGEQPESDHAVAVAMAANTIWWVDAEAVTSERLIEAVEPLELVDMRPQMLRHLIAAVAPDDPQAPQLITNYDPAVAAELGAPHGTALLNAFEPVFIEVTNMRPTQWRYAQCRIGLLAGNGWLVTHRSSTFDQRFGTRYPTLGPTSREKLIAAASDFQRTDQLAKDVATMMLRWLARRCLTVAFEIGDEIGNRMNLFHRVLVEPDVSLTTVEDTRAELFDLRWVLDTHERRIRGLLPAWSPQAFAWFADIREEGLAEEVEQILERALDECRTGRRELSDAMAWMTGEQNIRVLVQNAGILREQIETGKRTDRLQTLVGRITVFFLGPTLIATIFGAGTVWWDRHQEVRAAVLVAAMVVAGCVGALLVREREPDETIGPLGTPVYGWALRLGMQINRQVPRPTPTEIS
jgi:hypothetical protein